MIGKITIGSSFGGALRYVLQKPEATLIHAQGVRTDSIRSAIDDFNMQRKMNPDLGKAVGHIVLSWSSYDKEKLSAEIMASHAREYLQKMNISETQYLVAEHRDKSHPHIHIIYNRVNNQGKTISDRFQKQRNHKVCKDITVKYGYYLGKGKDLVNRQQLTGADKIKYELSDAITRASRTAQNWKQMEAILEKQGIGMMFKYKSGTSQIEGISFVKDGVKMKGSKIDRSLSFARLDRKIRQNQKLLITHRSHLPTAGNFVKSHSQVVQLSIGSSAEQDRLHSDLLNPVETHQDAAHYELRKRNAVNQDIYEKDRRTTRCN